VNVSSELTARHALLLVANLNSFAFDYCARQMLGGTHLSDYIMKQLPALPPSRFESARTWTDGRSVGDWVAARSLELCFTCDALAPFAEETEYSGPPFGWDSERRFQLRAELDAAFFHLYGLSREQVRYVMETFPIVKRKDEAKYGEYRTLDSILQRYDEFSGAER
jgi:hypothetical protein